jgi:hypothetical protein
MAKSEADMRAVKADDLNGGDYADANDQYTVAKALAINENISDLINQSLPIFAAIAKKEMKRLMGEVQTANQALVKNNKILLKVLTDVATETERKDETGIRGWANKE